MIQFCPLDKCLFNSISSKKKLKPDHFLRGFFKSMAAFDQSFFFLKKALKKSGYYCIGGIRGAMSCDYRQCSTLN